MATCRFHDFLKALNQTCMLWCLSQHAVGHRHKASLVSSPLEDLESLTLFFGLGGTGSTRSSEAPAPGRSTIYPSSFIKAHSS